MKYLYKFAAVVPFYIYIIAGIALIGYKILELHTTYKQEIKKLDKEEVELRQQYLSTFKRRAIAASIIIAVFAIVLAVFSYIGSLG